MAFWDLLRKAPGDVAVSVPLNYDVGQASYPDASFESFASEGYGKSEIVHACIRELAVSAASPRYYVQAPAVDGGAVEVTTGALYDITSKPNPTSDWYAFIENLVTFLMVAGNAYTLKERTRSGKVSALYHLRPDRVDEPLGPMIPANDPDPVRAKEIKRGDFAGAVPFLEGIGIARHHQESHQILDEGIPIACRVRFGGDVVKGAGCYLDGAAVNGWSLDVIPGRGCGDCQLADASVDDLALAVALGGEGFEAGVGVAGLAHVVIERDRDRHVVGCFAE